MGGWISGISCLEGLGPDTGISDRCIKHLCEAGFPDIAAFVIRPSGVSKESTASNRCERLQISPHLRQHVFYSLGRGYSDACLEEFLVNESEVREYATDPSAGFSSSTGSLPKPWSELAKQLFRLGQKALLDGRVRLAARCLDVAGYDDALLDLCEQLLKEGALVASKLAEELVEALQGRQVPRRCESRSYSKQEAAAPSEKGQSSNSMFRGPALTSTMLLPERAKDIDSNTQRPSLRHTHPRTLQGACS